MKLEDFQWSRLESREVFRCSIFRVREEPHTHPRIERPVAFSVLESNDWVNVIAIDRDSVRDPDARLLWVRQYRVGSERVTLEIPGGGCSHEDASPTDSGRRELIEETGASASRWIHLGSVNPNPAIFRNRVHTCLALGCRIDPNAVLGDGSEVLAPEWRPYRERYRILLEGDVDHALVFSAFALLDAHLTEATEIGRTL